MIGSAKHLHKYLPGVEQAKEIEDGGSATVYFKALDVAEIAVIKCSNQFLLEHCSALVECIKKLEGSTYPDLQDTFLLVSRGSVGELTSSKISNLQPAVKQCAQDSAKAVNSSVGKLFDPRNIPNNINDSSLYQIVKIVPLLGQVQEKKFLEGYLSFQKKVEAILQEESKVLEDMNGWRRVTVTLQSAISALSITPSNVDSERAFSSSGRIWTDLHTNLTVENIEIMLSYYSK
ncbi:hypothetical protein PR048_029264, partial [Dryococelus australis]